MRVHPRRATNLLPLLWPLPALFSRGIVAMTILVAIQMQASSNFGTFLAINTSRLIAMASAVCVSSHD
jgi:hypothetical protein